MKISVNPDGVHVEGLQAKEEKSLRLPELLIIGGPRCGTSTLFNMLCQVPGLWGTPQTREVHFFNRHWDEGLAWYAKKFAAAPKGDMILEATPFYLAAPFVAARVK